MSGTHNHDGHSHGPTTHTPVALEDREGAVWDQRSLAVQALLVEKGVVTADEVRAAIEDLESRTPALGARVVARAWTDPDFKQRLLADGKAAIAELLEMDMGGPEIVALQNSAGVHHVVVCTLCSCYPKALLGPPPAWYKSLPYRARTIADPRPVLRKFGLDLDPNVEIRVVDSTADMRYIVIPERPPGTEGMSEEELASLVTRDSMIGVARAKTTDD